MKKIISLLLAIIIFGVMIMPAFAEGENAQKTFPEQIEGGHGTSKDDPVMINTFDDWDAFTALCKEDAGSVEDLYFALGEGVGTQDAPVVLSSVDDWNAFVAFIGSNERFGEGCCFAMGCDIGSEQEPVISHIKDHFNGQFDGNNCRLYVALEAESEWDLIAPFGEYCNGAVLRNIVMDGSVKGYEASGFCYYLRNSTILNCINYAAITADAVAAGICASPAADTEVCINYIIDCENYGSITAAGDEVEYLGHAGGIACWSNQTSFVNCSNHGDVNGLFEAAGICTICEYECEFYNCLNDGDVTSETDAAGFFVELSNSTLINCANAGIVSGGSRSAGLIIDPSAYSLTNCYMLTENGFAGTTDGRTPSANVLATKKALCAVLNQAIIDNGKEGEWNTWTAKSFKGCPHLTFENGVCVDCNYVCEHPDKDENYICADCGLFDEEGVKTEIQALNQKIARLEALLGNTANTNLSSTFSGGMLALIIGIPALVIIGVAAFVIMKKKKTAVADGTEKTTSDKTDKET